MWIKPVDAAVVKRGRVDEGKVGCGTRRVERSFTRPVWAVSVSVGSGDLGE